MKVNELIGMMSSSKQNMVRLIDGLTDEVIFRGTDNGLFSDYENRDKEAVSFYVEEDTLCIYVPHEKTDEEYAEELAEAFVDWFTSGGLMVNIE